MRLQGARGGRFRLLLTVLLVAAVAAFSAALDVRILRGKQSAMIIPAVISCLPAASASNPIVTENLCKGTDSWQLTQPLGPYSDSIEGFVVPTSVNVGGHVQLYVSTVAHTYWFEVYRMGWYNGAGGRLVYSSTLLKGIYQAPPRIDAETHTVSASNWRDPVTLPIPTSWVSGIYVVKFFSSQGYVRYTPFVVRNDASRASILVVTSDITDQAYNDWGGYGLYEGYVHGAWSEAARAHAVSFDRPYSMDAGLGTVDRWELPLVRWLEREDYSVTYASDVDVDLSGSMLLHHQLIIFAGHDEYWTHAMRLHATTARNTGVSLAFFTANNVYWQARLGASEFGADRMVTCYRVPALDPMSKVNPALTTIEWRNPPVSQPEQTLLGESYVSPALNSAPMLLAPGATVFLRGTNLTAGSSLTGLVGGEFDNTSLNKPEPASLIVLASSPVTCYVHTVCPTGTNTADATIYTAASGARVFDAGTFQWSWGLDNGRFGTFTPVHRYASREFQIFTANILSYLLKSLPREIPQTTGSHKT